MTNGFLEQDDNILLMTNPPVFPGFEHRGDRSCSRKDYQLLADAGIKTAVMYTNWGLIEREFGKRDWSYLDKAIEDAASAGLKVLLSDYTWGAPCLPDDWYVASQNGVEKYMNQLSIWNKDAQDYVADFTREMAARYANERVNIFCTQAAYGESYLFHEILNIFYDKAALASFRTYAGAGAVPRPYGYRDPSNEPITDAWIGRSIIETMLRRNGLIMELNNRKEIWTSAHHLMVQQGAGNGSKFLRFVLDAYKECWPDALLHGIQYTVWVHGNNFNYRTMLREDITKYGIDYYAGAEYCDGIKRFTAELLASEFRGFIVAPFSILTDYHKLESWMLENIEHANKAISGRR